MSNQELISALKETLEIWRDFLSPEDISEIITKFTEGLESIDSQKSGAVIFLARQALSGDLSLNDEDDIIEKFSSRINTCSESPLEREKFLAFKIMEILMANYHKMSQKSLEAVLNELKSRIS
jgi:hypothetical protein